MHVEHGDGEYWYWQRYNDGCKASGAGIAGGIGDPSGEFSGDLSMFEAFGGGGGGGGGSTRDPAAAQALESMGVGPLEFLPIFGFAGTLGQKGLNFASKTLLTRHFQKHGAEVGAASARAYLASARSFFGTPGLQMLTRTNGDRVYYNALTNEFGVLNGAGQIRTYFVPTGDGLSYFLRQGR